jgi:hypothetical protein
VIKRSEALSGALPAAQQDTWTAGIQALMSDIKGKWTQAVESYLALKQVEEAALATIRLGDRELERSNFSAALVHYQQAAAYWRAVPPERSAVALALYRQAEVYWKQQEMTAQPMKRRWKHWINVNLRAHGPAIRKHQGDWRASSKRWPECNWQAYQIESISHFIPFLR